jgi:hypothetical protein
VEKVIRELRLEARTVDRPDRADAILALSSRSEDGRLRRIVETTALPLHLVKKNTTAQLRRLLQEVFVVLPGSDRHEVEEALREARAGAARALSEGVAVELGPRPARLRKLQHRAVIRSNLVAKSIGSEPLRHLVIHPDQSRAR